jgi:hypothetical protein
VELHGADRDIQLRGDLFIGAVAQDPLQDFLLSCAQRGRAGDGATLLQQLLRPEGQAVHKYRMRWDKHVEIGGLRASGEAFHGQKAGNPFHGKVQIRYPRGPELSSPCRLVAENKDVGIFPRTFSFTAFCLGEQIEFLHWEPSRLPRQDCIRQS